MWLVVQKHTVKEKAQRWVSARRLCYNPASSCAKPVARQLRAPTSSPCSATWPSQRQRQDQAESRRAPGLTPCPLAQQPVAGALTWRREAAALPAHACCGRGCEVLPLRGRPHTADIGDAETFPKCGFPGLASAPPIRISSSG